MARKRLLLRRDLRLQRLSDRFHLALQNPQRSHRLTSQIQALLELRIQASPNELGVGLDRRSGNLLERLLHLRAERAGRLGGSEFDARILLRCRHRHGIRRGQRRLRERQWTDTSRNLLLERKGGQL